MTRKRAAAIVAAILAGPLFALGGGVAAAAILAAGPPVTSPTPTVGPYYSGPVHLCASTSNEGELYAEEHSTARGNCARGFVQLSTNELTPAFALQLGSAVYSCTTSTTGTGADLKTMITCPAPSSSPAA